MAAEKGHDKVVQILLDSGANLEIRNNKVRNQYKNTALENCSIVLNVHQLIFT